MPNRAEMIARLNALLAVKASARAAEDLAVSQQQQDEQAEMAARHHALSAAIEGARQREDDLDRALLETVNAAPDLASIEAAPSPPEAAA